MAEIVGFFGRQNRSKLYFHFAGVFALADSKPAADADAVGVCYNGGLVVNIPNNQVGRFAADAGQAGQFFNGIWNNAAKIGFQHPAHGENISCLRFVKTAGMNVAFYFFLCGAAKSV